jgi:YbbR domain-containing protein
VLVSDRIDELRVTIKGPWRKLRGFDERELDRVTLDLRRQTGPEITITPDMINVPSGMTVTSITPRTLRVTFERRLEKIVEVQPALIGRPAHGFVVAEVTADPKTIRVKGAEGVLRGLQSVRTREISLDGRSDTFKLDTEIVPPEGIESVGTTPIRIQVHLDEELVSRKITSLTIIPRGEGVDTSKWIISPPQVDITLTGALLAVEKAKDAMTPVVKVLEVEPKGRDAAIVVIENLPPGVGVKVSPERVKIAPAVLNPRP